MGISVTNNTLYYMRNQETNLINVSLVFVILNDGLYVSYLFISATIPTTTTEVTSEYEIIYLI